MKLAFIFLFVILGMGIKDGSDSKVYSSTGHSQFSEIVMENEEAFIIHDVSDKYIDECLDDLKWKLFGSRDRELNKDEDASYVSNVVFSRSNKTREAYTFVYDTSKIVYHSVSVSVKGGLNAKSTFKTKATDIAVSGDLSASRTEENETRETENGKLSVVVYPGKMITLRIVGKAKITNGVLKNFVFGICVKKGAYEVITVTSTCYELLETDA